MRTKIISIILMVILLSIAYNGITQLGFAKVDDDWMLLRNKYIGPEINFAYLRSIFFLSKNDIQYSPLNLLFYQGIYRINGFDPYWFHLSCLIVHFANTVLIYMFSKRIFETFKVFSDNIFFAGLCALIWSLHPINVESVVWVSASKILLFSFFGLLSFICFIDAIESRSISRYVLSVILFILSCFCKEQAVVMPILFIVFLVCYHLNSEAVTFRRMLLLLIPFTIIMIIFGLITLEAAGNLAPKEVIPDYPFFYRLLLPFYCLCFYVFNLLMPVDLHYHYPFPVVPNGILSPLYAFPFVLAALSFFLYTIFKHSRNKVFYIFSALFFLAHLSLCIHIIPLKRPSVMADRYMYLPALGLIFILAHYISGMYLKCSKTIKASILIAVGIYVVFLCLYTHKLVGNWKDLDLLIFN